MPVQVATAAEIAEVRAEIAELRRQLQRVGRSEWIRAADFPGGARRARRLREAGKISGYRMRGSGRAWFYKREDLDRLMIPQAPPEPKAEPVVECGDGAEYAESNLGLLTGSA